MSVPINYDASDVIGAGLYSISNVDVFSYTDANGNGVNLVKSFPKDRYLGMCTSYLIKGGVIWFEIKNPEVYGIPERYYVKYDPSKITANEEDLYRSPEEIEANKPTLTDTIVGTITKIVMIGAGAYVLVNITTSLINQNNEKK